MKKIINLLIDEAVQNADTYTNNGSTWLIFTDDKRWVIELTKEGTLWYNYNFFKSLFAYTSMDVVENQNYITNWVEDNIINKKKPVQNGVKSTRISHIDNHYLAEDTLQNGVKHTIDTTHHKNKYVEDTIQNGVKDTIVTYNNFNSQVEHTIQNGVKHTEIGWAQDNGVEDAVKNGVKYTGGIGNPMWMGGKVKDTIQNGVKETHRDAERHPNTVEDTIQNGVKHTEFTTSHYTTRVEDTIQNGVKETKNTIGKATHTIEDTIQNGVKETKIGSIYPQRYVEKIMQNGVKHTQSSIFDNPTEVKDTIKNGVKNIRHSKSENDSRAENTIQNGVKHTSWLIKRNSQCVEDAIQNGVKKTVPIGIDKDSIVSNDFGMNEAIQNGVKKTKPMDEWVNTEKIVDKTIQNGVKNTDFLTDERNYPVEDAIQNGVIHTRFLSNNRAEYVEHTIQNGVKKTYSDKIPHEYDWSDQFTEDVEDTIQNGVKHTEKSLQIDGSCVIEDVIKEGVIEHGIKETKSEVATREWKAGEVINGGIKETTPGGYLGSVERKGKMVHQFEHSKQDDNVEDVIKSGIKATTTNLPLSQDDGQIAEIEDVIKNGIKKTEAAALFDEESKIDTVISNGIKETIPVVPGDILDTIDFMSYNNTTNVQHLISDVIEKGIKETHDDVMPHTGRVEGVIKNGVKKTVDALSSRLPNPVKDVIKNGVKECIPSRTPLYNPMDFSVQYRENHRLDDVASVLEKGIKEVQPLPSQEGNMDYSNYYYRQGDRTIPHTQYVDDVIENGKKFKI